MGGGGSSFGIAKIVHALGATCAIAVVVARALLCVFQSGTVRNITRILLSSAV